MRARVAAAFATLDLSALPNYCIGFDIGGEREDINTDRTRLMVLASKHGGLDCAVLDTSYFRTLRFEANYWYCFAGYFTRSRWPVFVRGAATVVCRRGLHGGVMAFYDEQTQWATMQEVIEDATAVLRAAGCVPYKSGKIWAGEVRAASAYYSVLERIKRGLDPHGMFSPGNLGLDG